MKWFKFYGQDYLSDPKMLSLTACERSCWITLLSFASVNDNGMITFLSEEQLMLHAGISPLHEEWEQTKGILEKLQKLQMITHDNGKIAVTNWQKRQEVNLTSYERVKRHREKKRNDNAKITLEENRIEKNRREENKIKEDMSANADPFLQFWKAYPKKEQKKKAQQIWKSKKLDSSLQEILSFIEKAQNTDRWKKGYVKQPTAFLNGECWNDDVSAYNDKFQNKPSNLLPVKIGKYDNLR